MENEKSAKKYRQQLMKLSNVNQREVKVYQRNIKKKDAIIEKV